MQTISRTEMLRTSVKALRNEGKSIALVPTMGALHKGHLALMAEARRRADHVVASIFVNPKQFGPGEDLDTYPRQLTRDQEMLESEGVDLLWAPSPELIYPPGYATTVSVARLGDGLCGANRPGHFDGVATIVCKLFQQVMPDFAIFGEKDWQQLAIIRQMARDLDFTQPLAENIIGLATVREADGLALSSRNQYLSVQERQRAAALPRAMAGAVGELEAGAAVHDSLQALESALIAAGFDSVDYAVLADAASLEALSSLDERPARLLVAARIGRTRLIDNVPVSAR